MPEQSRRSPVETRSEIIDAARTYLHAHPFRDLSVKRLMAETSVGRSAFYIHFPDLSAVAAELLHSIDDDLAEATRAGRKGPEFLRSLPGTLANVVDIWAQHGPVIRAIAEASAQDGRLEELYRRKFTQQVVDRVCHAIQAAQDRGEVDPDLDPMETATLLSLMNERYLGDRLGRRPQADLAVVRMTLITAWQRMLQPPSSVPNPSEEGTST